jgi:hypothetical protein
MHALGALQVNYKNVMKQYNLGPNGGILTSLNLFATRFDQVALLPARMPCLHCLHAWPACTVWTNLQTLRQNTRVLRNPCMGGYSDVQSLLNR